MKQAIRVGLGLAVLLASARAESASLAFQAVATAATTICAAPCHQVRAFVEDPTRSLSLQGVEFSVDVMEGASVSNIPLIASPNSNARGARTTYIDEFGDAYPGLPWNLLSDVAQTAHVGFDVQFVSVNDDPIDFSTIASAPCTIPVETCSILAGGYPLNRLYVGRFNVTRTPGASGVNLRIGGEILALGPELEADLQALNGVVVFVPYPVPEPEAFLVIATALVGLTFQRLSVRTTFAPFPGRASRAARCSAGEN